MDASKILDSLYVGSFPYAAADVKSLASLGITGVLNLQSDEDLRYLGIDWPALRAAYFAEGIEARRVPIIDFNDSDLCERLPDAVATLGEMLDQGRTVYLHCNAGVNRSPSVALCYLHWELEEAESHLRSRRPCAPVMPVIRQATHNRG